MVGRTAHDYDSGPQFSARTPTTDGRGKGVAFAGDEGSPHTRRAAYDERARTTSLSSEDSEGYEHVNTLLSASSIANTDTISSSGYSTAMTSATTYDERSNDSTPIAEPPYAPPSLTLLELVSNTASSSALPDSFDVNVSRKGGYVAVYSASNLFLIKTVQLPRLWARTLQVKRKPVAIDITEDGFLLAVLSRPSQVDLYEIHGEGDNQIKKRRTIMLVIAIGPEVPETTRRTLSGPAGDALEFSDDGRTLLITGYARKSDGSALFVLPGLYDGPLTEEGEPIPQPPEAAWTGSVLFPETARIARQATLLPDADTGTFNELFAFNAEEDSWGIYDIACQRFTQRKMFLPDHARWTRSEFVDDAMPAVSPNADLAAVALRMRGTTNIWIYEVPGWEYKPSEKTKVDAPIQPCFCIPIPNDNAGTLQEICVLRWVRLNANVQRLVAVGNSNVLPDENDVPGAPLGSKGVLIVLDFDKTKPLGSAPPTPLKTEYDLDPLCPGEMLPEGSIDFDREVELVRTRTMAQRRAQDRNDTVARRPSRIGTTPVQRSRTTANPNAPRPRLPSDESEELTPEEAQAMFEAPYDNQQPRSQMSLARAATVAAVSPANRRHLRALPFRPLEYRRADGHRELPHESDADNWVPPPPAYTTTAAAAESVSLSHPDAPPVPRLPHAHTSSSIPPVPRLPTNMSATIDPSQLSPSHPYQQRQQSISSIDVSSPPPPEPTRRPSLIHPSTYPSPQSSDSIRRRRSSTRSPPEQMSYTPLSHTPRTSMSASAYPNTSSHMPTRRPTNGSTTQRVAHDNLDLYASPPVPSLPPNMRRGSAPNVAVQRRPLPPTSPRMSMQPYQTAPMASIAANQQPRNAPALPPLAPPGQQFVAGQRFPVSAPPRTDQVHNHPYGMHRASQSVGNLISGRRGSRVDHDGVLVGEKEKKGKGRKKIGCVVM
ncbi:hypothetical protein AA0118_g11278 [Alternaria tenuissima]|nr:hypothetical protein AA0118_g11278 [Alternaria tenuissima]